MSAGATREAVEAVWRIESARLIGALVRMVRDVDLAEDLAQDALVAALERWPETGIPRKPGAWLLATARNRGLDRLRHEQMRNRKLEMLQGASSTSERPDIEAALDDPVGDDLLRLVFVACHPVLSLDARVALTLRLVGGLTTAEIARSFLLAESTVAQRIVRAKRRLTEARVPFEVPRGAELTERLPAVLEVIYVIFGEGHAATSGERWTRPELCEDALRLARILSTLVPGEPEVHGLLALLELQASRLPTRQAPDGRAVLLLDQDRSRWDRLLIRRGLEGLKRALSMQQPPGVYTLQAAIAACHARALTPEQTDWPQIVALYDALVALTGSPVVELNRAMAVSMAYGADLAIAQVEELTREPALQGYAPLHAVRGDLFQRLERWEEAREAFQQAAKLTENLREREVLLQRARECGA